MQVMQFGRIDNNAYTLDFQYPYSAIQAFAVALANVTQRLKWPWPDNELCVTLNGRSSDLGRPSFLNYAADTTGCCTTLKRGTRRGVILWEFLGKERI